MESCGSCGDRAVKISIKVELECEIELFYEMLEQVILDPCEICGKGYSIEIRAKVGNEIQSVMLEDVSREYDEALSILSILWKNTVTPETALCIMEDYFS